jgi:hypothetical protein
VNQANITITTSNTYKLQSIFYVSFHHDELYIEKKKDGKRIKRKKSMSMCMSMRMSWMILVFKISKEVYEF